MVFKNPTNNMLDYVLKITELNILPTDEHAMLKLQIFES